MIYKINMAFRRRLTSLKNFAIGAFESLGSNLTAPNYQTGKGLVLTKSLPWLCNGTRSSGEIIGSCQCEYGNGNISLMQLVQQKILPNKDHYFMSNVVKDSCNPIWMSKVFTSHLTSFSFQINNWSISRNFTTLVPIKRRAVGMQAAIKINEVNIKCCKMKHSLPKVPPTRMMSIYDLERTITDEEAAKEFVYALKAGERKFLYLELARFHGDTAVLGSAANEPPTRQQLKLVTLHQMFPFIGFGFLDNFLMIVAGEYIDLMLGATLGISTMAAAALGNWFSDVCGLGSAHYVENFVARFGIRHPHLSPEQVDMKSTKWASNFGKVIGVTIGCFLGMIPLLFFHDEKKKKEEKEKEKKDTAETKEQKK